MSITEDTTTHHDTDSDATREASPADRPAIQIGGEAETIRVLTTALGQGALPDVYVSSGQLVHLSRVSGSAANAAEHAHQAAAGALPVRADPLTAPSLAWLLAHHTFLYRDKLNKQTDQWEQVEASPTKAALSAVLTTHYWPDVRPLTVSVFSRPDFRWCSRTQASLWTSSCCDRAWRSRWRSTSPACRSCHACLLGSSRGWSSQECGATGSSECVSWR